MQPLSNPGKTTAIGQSPARGRLVAAAVEWRWHHLALAGVALLMLAPVLTIPTHIPVEYNEGWNAYFTQRAIDPASGPLYPPATALISNNYPPLSFYIVGAAARVIGDPIVAGRLVALFSLLAVALMAGRLARLAGAAPRWAVATTILFLYYVTMFFPRYVAMDDPQWSAHAVMLVGLGALFRSGAGRVRADAGAVAAAALLIVTGLFIKHNLLALPAAVTLWLLIVDRRAAAIWCATGLAATLAALAVIDLKFGGNFVVDVLQHKRGFNPDGLAAGAIGQLYFIPLIGVAATLVKRRRELHPGVTLLLIFAAIAVPLGICERAGDGVSSNAHFEAAIALAILAGVGLSIASDRRPGTSLLGAPVMLVLLALPLLLLLPSRIVRGATAVATLNEQAAAWDRMEAKIAATPGPVACELLAVCYWAGKDFEWDFFNQAERLRAGAPLAPLGDRIAGRQFAAIALTRKPGFADSDGQRLPQPLPRLIERYYRPAMTAPLDTVLMVPRAGDAATVRLAAADGSR
ncbi:MAG: hypothetical protein ACRYG4_24240 [Janthinobacterium lividum]